MDVTLIRLVSGIVFCTLLVLLIVKAIKPTKDSTSDGGTGHPSPSGDRMYIYGGIFFCVLIAVMTNWGRIEGIPHGIGRALGHAFVACVIAYIAYGRKKNWRKFSRLFFWLCLIFTMLPFYPLPSK